ncbi:MAG: hypothetical protein ACFFD1_07015, partial [Candidatus Thorarchaeota archaeon]
FEYFEKTKGLFIIINFLALLYFYWIVTVIYLEIIQLSEVPFDNFLVLWLNILILLLLIVLLIYEWYYYLQWNKKVKRLKKLEEEIFVELQLD